MQSTAFKKALPVTDDNLIAGARGYGKYCAVCHGLDGQPETEIAKGMFPEPPQLFKGHGVTDDPVGETYWKIENGIRLTGMPAFRQSLSENQIWQIALCLRTPTNFHRQRKRSSARLRRRFTYISGSRP